MNKARKRESSGDFLNEKQNLLNELDTVKKEINRYENLINLLEDEDLIEAYIYEHKALELKLGYLIKLARDRNINIEYIERCS